MANPNDKRTASQRIEDLERAVMSMFQASNGMGNDLMNAKQAVKLMNNKLDAIIKLLNNKEDLTGENISRVMLENDVAELKAKVDNLIARGVLVAQDTAEEGCFVVGSEAEPAAADGTAGKVVNPRVQFSLSAINEELRKQFFGKKVGETLTFQDDNLVFNLLEVYKIVTPKPAQQPDDQIAPAPAPVAEAPATTEAAPEAAPATQSSSDAAPQAAAPAAPEASAPSSSQAAGN